MLSSRVGSRTAQSHSTVARLVAVQSRYPSSSTLRWHQVTNSPAKGLIKGLMTAPSPTCSSGLSAASPSSSTRWHQVTIRILPPGLQTRVSSVRNCDPAHQRDPEGVRRGQSSPPEGSGG
eukprot:136540-Prorocentrum_minimum.AAC.1